ncbi:MAG: TIGR04282 family arsenosugar biosynthesis glycosyltransferase [Chlorobiaceae bacterium]
MNAGRLLIVFTRNPVQGEVKTRLAGAIGAPKALEVYERLRAHTASVAGKVDVHRRASYSDSIPSLDIFTKSDFSAVLQEGYDLGERMLNAFRQGFRDGYNQIVLTGTDCFEITPLILEEAFTALEGSDAVVGPARDGGFYLIGMKKVLPELFLKRTWSTPEVLAETIRILGTLQATYELLDELADIDTFDDLKASALWPLPS